MFIHRLDADTHLELLEQRHAPALFALIEANRERLRAWLPWVDRTRTVADSEAYIGATQDQWAGDNGFVAGIWHRGALAGVVGYHKVELPKRATDLGYWLGAAHEGKGLMTLAVRALIAHAFGPLGLNRVEIRCATDNLRSRALPERLGFTLEGVLRDNEWLYDHHVDHAVYSLLAREWDPADRPEV